MTKEKKLKIVKALKLLFIGELFICAGLLGELYVVYDPLAVISLISFIGIIITFVGIIKLAKYNKFFLLSTLVIAVTILLGIASAVLVFIKMSKDVMNTYNSITSIISKLLSMAFIFGIIRGCSKAATGSARSSFATAMTLVNFFGKLLAIVFTILEGVFRDKSSIASQTFAIVSMSLSVFVEIFFVVYTYRAYNKAKKHFEIAHAN